MDVDNPSNQTEEQPSTRPKADIVHPSRLQGFCDAVYATAATLLIIPVRKFELEFGELLSHALLSKWLQFVLFLLGYLIICRLWEARVMMNRIVNKVDDFIVALTLVSLMVTTFLPFSIALLSHFDKYNIAILLFSLLLLTLDLIKAAIYIYSFYNPSLLSERFQQLEPEDMKVEKRHLFMKGAVDCSLLALAAIFSYVSIVVSMVFISALIFMPLIIRRIFFWIHCLPQSHGYRNYRSPLKISTGSIDKERIECFSDAAIAIVATLLILDLTTEDFPTQVEVEKKGLEKTLSDMWEKFGAYIGSYALISFLWFVNHSVLHHIKVFTHSMILANKLFLAFLAATPLVYTVLDMYTGSASHNARVAVGFSAVILFCSSFSNVLLLVCALYKKHVTMHEWAFPERGEGTCSNNKVHTYLLLKTLILPIVSFFTFISSLTSNYACYVVYHIAIFTVPVSFIALKVVYTCHCRRGSESNKPSIQNSPEGSNVDVTVSDISLSSRNSLDG